MKYTAYVALPETHAGFTWTPGYRNVRVPVQEPQQEAPDPIRQGATPSRPSKVQIATFRYDMNASMAEDFQNVDVIYPRAESVGVPRGRMEPFTERANIAPPQHVAYGSLFQAPANAYGYG